jgi:hypothetical protein
MAHLSLCLLVRQPVKLFRLRLLCGRHGLHNEARTENKGGGAAVGEPDRSKCFGFVPKITEAMFEHRSSSPQRLTQGANITCELLSCTK